MQKSIIASLITGLALVATSGAVSAQDDSPRIVPVELFTCSYNDGKGPADLDKVIARWNEWADKNYVDNYAAWTLTPYYFGAEQEFDVIWMGAGKDGVALGRAQDLYNAEEVGLHAAFDDVLTCDAHSNFASIQHKAPPKGSTPGDSVMTFSDCTFEQGATFEALNAAMSAWSQYQGDAGSTSPIWHWYPAYGGGSEEFSFKWLQSYKNLAELGADYDRYGTGAGWVTHEKLLGELIDCDSTRAYLAKSRRYVQLR